MTEREDAISRIERVIRMTNNRSITVTIPKYTAQLVVALLKEQSQVVRCKDCKHRPKEPNWKTYESGFDIEFPEGSKCPCQCSSNEYYSWYPEDDWFCADGERKEGR